MRIYNLLAYNGCNRCKGAMSYMTPIASEDDLVVEDLTFDDLLEMINHNENTTCVQCQTVGDFTTLYIDFQGKRYSQ